MKTNAAQWRKRQGLFIASALVGILCASVMYGERSESYLLNNPSSICIICGQKPL
jgi:hypothetical protein